MKTFRIGRRITKTLVAVFFTLIIYVFLMLIDQIFGFDNKVDAYAPTNWYTPFFAGIATVYAMQNNPKGSINQAKIRSWGSIIGGYIGGLIIHLFEKIYIFAAGASSLEEVANDFLFKILIYITTSVGLLILIPVMVKLKKQPAIFIACLTYLSVTISIRNGGMPILFFTTNRVISTLIGVGISLLVNSYPFSFTKNKNILFVYSLDSNAIEKEKAISPFSIFKLNDLFVRGCTLSLVTTKALTGLGNIFNNVDFEDSIVMLNGVSTYNPKKKEFFDTCNMKIENRYKIEELLNKRNVDFFTYLINNGVLSCYYNKLTQEGSTSYYEKRKNGAYYSFAQAITPKTLDVGQFVVIEKTEIIMDIINELKELGIDKECDLIYYPYIIEGYSLLKIDSTEASKYNSLMKLKHKGNFEYLICCGAGNTDIETMQKADFSFCLKNAPDNVKNEADYIIDSDNQDDILKFIDKIYHKKDFINYLNSIKTA